MTMSLIQARTYASYLLNHCTEKERNAILQFHLNCIFNDKKTQIPPALASNNQSQQPFQFPSIETIKDFAFVLLHWYSEHEKCFEIINSTLDNSQMYQLFKAMLLIAAGPDIDVNHNIGALLRNKSMITLLLHHFLQRPKRHLADTIKDKCEEFVRAIYDDQPPKKTDVYTMSEGCAKVTKAVLLTLNEQIISFISKEKRVLNLFSIISSCLHYDQSLQENERIQILLAALSIYLITNVPLHHINYALPESEYSPQLVIQIVGRYLVKVFAHLLTTTTHEKMDALEYFPSEYKNFIGATNREPYLKFYQNLDLELIQTYTLSDRNSSRKTNETTKEGPVAVADEKILLRIQELFSLTAFSCIYIEFQSLTNELFTKRKSEIDRAKLCLEQQMEYLETEKNVVGISQPSKLELTSFKEDGNQFYAKALEICQKFHDDSFPFIPSPHKFSNFIELLNQIQRFSKIYELYNPGQLHARNNELMTHLIFIINHFPKNSPVVNPLIVEKMGSPNSARPTVDPISPSAVHFKGWVKETDPSQDRDADGSDAANSPNKRSGQLSKRMHGFFPSADVALETNSQVTISGISPRVLGVISPTGNSTASKSAEVANSRATTPGHTSSGLEKLISPKGKGRWPKSSEDHIATTTSTVGTLRSS